MSKKKTGAIPTCAPQKEKKMVIDMNKAELAKNYQVAGFRTGKHMSGKDRPRKKNWKREYEREKDRSGNKRHCPNTEQVFFSGDISFNMLGITNICIFWEQEKFPCNLRAGKNHI